MGVFQYICCIFSEHLFLGTPQSGLILDKMHEIWSLMTRLSSLVQIYLKLAQLEQFCLLEFVTVQKNSLLCICVIGTFLLVQVAGVKFVLPHLSS